MSTNRRNHWSWSRPSFGTTDAAAWTETLWIGSRIQAARDLCTLPWGSQHNFRCHFSMRYLRWWSREYAGHPRYAPLWLEFDYSRVRELWSFLVYLAHQTATCVRGTQDMQSHLMTVNAWPWRRFSRMAPTRFALKQRLIEGLWITICSKVACRVRRPISW